MHCGPEKEARNAERNIQTRTGLETRDAGDGHAWQDSSMYIGYVITLDLPPLPPT